MRMSKELKARARRKRDERGLAKELKINGEIWAKKCAAIAKHGGRLAPGGILYLTKERVFLGSVKEWMAIVARQLNVPEQFVHVTIPTKTPDLSLKTLPSMTIAIPDEWFEAQGIAAKSEAHMMTQKSMANIAKTTMQFFASVVRKRYEICGYEVPDNDESSDGAA